MNLRPACILLLSLLGIPPSGGQDLYVNFEDVAAGTTDSAINPDTISKANGNVLAVSWSGSAGKVSVENGGMNMIGFTKHLLCKADNTVSAPQRFTWKFAPTRKASYGYFITLSNFTGRGSYYGAGGLETSTDYQILSIVNNNPPFFQNEGRDSPYGENIPVQNNLLIWVTGLWDSAQSDARLRSRMNFYNATNMSLLGSSIAPGITQNATVNTFKYGIHDAHSKDAGTAYRLGPVLLWTDGAAWPVLPRIGWAVPPVPPPVAPPPTVTLTGLSSSEVNAAIAAARDGDHIRLPAGTATWNSGVTWTRNNVTLSGQGMNSTVITADGNFTAFDMRGAGNTVSDLQIRGDGTTDEADGFMVTGRGNRFSRLYLRELYVAIYAKNFGLVDQCQIDDCWRVARVIMPISFFAANYPVPWDSDSAMVFEDFIFQWTGSKNQKGNQVFISSQTAQSIVLRHGTFHLDSTTSPQPFIDYHGDNPPCFGCPGPLGLQVYSNIVNVVAGDVSGSKFVDVRGNRALIYGNRVVGGVVGQGITLREEHNGDSPNHRVNNTYVWANKDGASGTSAMRVKDDGNITEGVDYFTSAPVPLVALEYPHPLRRQGTTSGGSLRAPVNLRLEQP